MAPRRVWCVNPFWKPLISATAECAMRTTLITRNATDKGKYWQESGRVVLWVDQYKARISYNDNELDNNSDL
jgi:hypothetical protein